MASEVNSQYQSLMTVPMPSTILKKKSKCSHFPYLILKNVIFCWWSGGDDGVAGLNLLHRAEGRVLNLGAKTSVSLDPGVRLCTCEAPSCFSVLIMTLHRKKCQPRITIYKMAVASKSENNRKLKPAAISGLWLQKAI